MPADITACFEPDTATVTYLLADPATKQAAVIGSVLDYDAASGRTSRNSADKLMAHSRTHGLKLNGSWKRMRTARDKTLKLPALILPAVQCNIRAGQMPEPDAQGRRLLRVPVNAL
ncbi:MAG: hypothetical protein JOZ05_09785 [Acetobacteraceae bacterium]|nr:hypothetical protein [Acetobacteraceae bacterium]